MVKSEGEKFPPNGHEKIIGGRILLGDVRGGRRALDGGRGVICGARGRGNGEDDDNEDDPYGFPIQDTETNFSMNNISPSLIPNVYGMRTK